MGDQRFWELCAIGDIEGVQAAIDNDADVNEDSYWGATGLMCALNNGYNNVVQLLLHHPQINVNKVDEDGSSALDCAVAYDNHEGLGALLAQHDELTSIINLRDSDGWTPIMFAVVQNSVNSFQLLLTNPHVDLDTRDDYVRNPQEFCW